MTAQTARWATWHRLVGIPLALSTLGAAFPYTETSPGVWDLTAWDWAVTALFVATAIGLMVSLVVLSSRQLAWAYLGAGAVWMMYAMYRFLLVDMTWTANLGQGFVAFGVAVAALGSWRMIQKERVADIPPRPPLPVREEG